MARLRSQGPAMEHQDSTSSASSRKRRAISPLRSPRKDIVDHTTASEKLSSIVKTPTKSKKKVRFSDPGPETSSIGTTGITPFVSRTSLSCGMDQPAPSTPRLLAQPARRRTSVPSSFTFGELGSSSNPIEVHQFLPLRQTLTPRTQRQLKRNHLSEVMNEIQYEQRSVAKLQREIENLKHELSSARNPESAHLAEEESSNLGRIQELEDEISALKQEVSSSAGSSLDMVPVHDDEDNTPLGDEYPPTSSPSTVTEVEYMTTISSHGTLSTPATSPEPSTPRSTSSIGMQTDISSQSINTLYSFAQSQSRQLTRARIALERLYPGESTLPLSLSGDAGPLMDTILSLLESSKAQIEKGKAAIASSQAQEAAMRGNFTASLRQLDEVRTAHAKLIAQTQQEQGSALREAETRTTHLERMLQEHEQSHAKLTAALNKYRDDIKGLEALVEGLEIERAGSMAQLREEKEQELNETKKKMEESISDLECMVAAETRGRREAESACDELGLQAKEASNRENEVREALNQKQNIIRELETSMESMKQIWAQEAGGLNARIGQLHAEAECKSEDLKLAEAEIRKLVNCVSVEKEAAQKGLASMRAEIERCSKGAETIGLDYASGAEARREQAVSALGLLTPTVEGGRFRDVGLGSESLEGHVEPSRGKAAKRKTDSGIGLLLEDVEEE